MDSGFVPEGEVVDVISGIFSNQTVYTKFLSNINIIGLCVLGVSSMMCLQSEHTVHRCMGKQPKWGSSLFNK